MRILLINQFYAPDTAATGQLMGDLAGRLVARGHEVHVICSRTAYGGGMLEHPAHELREGVHVHRLRGAGLGRTRLVGRLLDYVLFYLLAMVKALRLGRMDVCLALTTPPFIAKVGVWLKRLGGTRLVLWSMDVYPQVAVALGYLRPRGPLHWLLTRAGRAIYRKCDRIISLGEVMTQRLIEAGAAPEKIVTVHNWVPGESVAALAPGDSPLRASLCPHADLAVMYSGNLGVGHELDTAVEAFASLNRPGAALVFVGHGKMQTRLETMVREKSLANISFQPSQPLELLGASLAAGDIHLVSQRPQTQGLIVPSKLYGIMAAARPVIFIGPPDTEVAAIIKQSGCGLIVPCGDAAALAAAIGQLAADAGLRTRMGQAGQDYYRGKLGMVASTAAIAGAIEGVGEIPNHKIQIRNKSQEAKSQTEIIGKA
ncbi:MAG: glycosyltransferase family 4 protein [Planctomycetaceae bacterium]|nr:glycosyltransferase family 4 protein [Planctomycetaceae bacterium]